MCYCFELFKKFLYIEHDQKNQEIFTYMIQPCKQIQNIYKSPDVKLISFIEAQYDPGQLHEGLDTEITIS